MAIAARTTRATYCLSVMVPGPLTSNERDS